MKIFKKLPFLFLIIFLLLTTSSFCFSADETLELSYPIIGGQTLTTQTLLPDFVKYIFNLVIGISGLIAFGILIYAGIEMLTSVGDSGKMNEAKNRISSAFLGLIILLCSYIILSTINPDLITITMPEINSGATTTP
jgi:hypothetical protein